MLDPADSAEALAFTREAFELSERFDVPVFIRSTVRVSHTKCPVELGERASVDRKPYEKDQSKWVMMPLYAKGRRLSLDERIERVRAFAESSPLNRIEEGSSEIGVICLGATYQHVREALPEASILKLGISWPLPPKLLETFANSGREGLRGKEASTYLSNQVKAAGIALEAPVGEIPPYGELTPGVIGAGFRRRGRKLPRGSRWHSSSSSRALSWMPPSSGFPRARSHESYRYRRYRCYTLGAMAPLSAIDTCVDMGASISMAHGFELGLEGVDHKPVVAVIGDSTFAHSGITSLLNTVYNCGVGTVCILDNRTTAMTGHQGNPVNGITLQHRPSRELDLPALVRALGVDDVRTVDPMDMKETRRAKEAVASDCLSVIVFQSPCVLLTKDRAAAYEVRSDCRACGTCSLLGCPAISCDPETKTASIDASLCVGCSQCAQACPYGCIEQTGGSHE